MGQALNPEGHADPDKDTLPSGLIGEAFEMETRIEHETCMALQDTGSQVTTVSNAFYTTRLSHLPLYPCEGLVKLEGAGGESIPYNGYVIASIQLDGFEPLDIPVLVVREINLN